MTQPDAYSAPPRDEGDGAGQAVLSGAAGLLMSGLVVAQRLAPYPDLADHYWAMQAWWYAPLLVFAVVVAMRGRSMPRRVLGLLVAAATIGLDYWWQRHLAYRVWVDIGLDPNSTWGGIVWVLPSALLVLLSGVAWGFARRRGAIWMVGPLVAAVAIAVVLHGDLIIDHLPGEGTAGDVSRALVLPAAVWLACLLGWLLDKATTRDRSTGRVYPAVGHSDSPYTQY